MSNIPPPPPPPPPPADSDYIPRPPSPPNYQGPSHAVTQNPKTPKNPYAEQPKDLTTYFNRPYRDDRIFSNVSSALATSGFPVAGSVSPSGGIVQSSKFVAQSNMREDGVQHMQAWRYKDLGESGSHGEAREWFQKHEGSRRKHKRWKQNGNHSSGEESD